MATEETEIEKKQNNKNKNNKDQKDNWLSFMYSCIGMLIITIILGLIGSNFIYLANLKQDAKDCLFPTNINDYFPQKIKQTGGKSSIVSAAAIAATVMSKKQGRKSEKSKNIGSNNVSDMASNVMGSLPTLAKGFTSESCKTGISKDKMMFPTPPIPKFLYQNIPNPDSVPAANWLKWTQWVWWPDFFRPPILCWSPTSPGEKNRVDFDKKGVLSIIQYWVFYTIAYIYIYARTSLVSVLNLFDGRNKTVTFFSGIILFLLTFTFMIPLMIIIWLITLLLGLKNGILGPPGGYITSILACFCSWCPATLCAIAQPIQLFFTFTILPLLYDSNRIKNILASNKQSLGFLFTGLCVIASIMNLSTISSTVMVILYLLMLVRTLFKQNQ